MYFYKTVQPREKNWERTGRFLLKDKQESRGHAWLDDLLRPKSSWAKVKKVNKVNFANINIKVNAVNTVNAVNKVNEVNEVGKS